MRDQTGRGQTGRDQTGRDQTETGIVLAAGRGTRLAPLTDSLAKPAVPLLNRAIVCWALEALREAGITRIGVNAKHCADTVAEVVSRWADAGGLVPPEIIRERDLMGTGGGARGVWEGLGRPPGLICVLNGDIVTRFSLEAVIRAHRESGAAATLVVQSAGEGRILVQPSGDGLRVVGLPTHADPVRISESQGPESREVSFCGAYIIDSAILSQVPLQPGCLIRDGLVPRLLEGAHIGAFESKGIHWDVGTPQRFWSATRRLLDESARVSTTNLPDCASSVEILPPALIAPDTVFEGDNRVGPYVVLGGGSRLERGASVSHASLFGARVSGDLAHRVVVGKASLKIEESPDLRKEPKGSTDASGSATSESSSH